MTYRIKEMFYSFQGEGYHTGRPAVFIRFSGCNLWSGREADRAGAVCSFCDTDFRGTDGDHGGSYEGEELVKAALGLWPDATVPPWIVLTGGEPALQIDADLIARLRAEGARVAVETNGTRPLPEGLDWITVSPKAGTTLRMTAGDECKLVYPQDGLDPAEMLELSFRYFFLQPRDGPQRELHTRLARDYCARHPRWRLSLQTQKWIGIP